MFGFFNKNFTKDKVTKRMLERLYEELHSSAQRGTLNRSEVERIQAYIQNNIEAIKVSATEFANIDKQFKKAKFP